MFQTKIINANESYKVILKCPAIAFPPPHRIWKYGNNKIASNMDEVSFFIVNKFINFLI